LHAAADLTARPMIDIGDRRGLHSRALGLGMRRLGAARPALPEDR
jgi:hypothetical protein